MDRRDNTVFQQRLQTALDYWSDWNPCPIERVQPFESGLTNDSYLLEANGKKFVLRINSLNSAVLDLNRPIELEIIQSASRVGIGAKLKYSDPDGKYLVFDYIEGQQWLAELSTTASGISKLVSLLRAIHRLDPVSHYLDVQNKASIYWQSVRVDKHLANAILPINLEVRSHIEKAMAANTHPCLCHNDLVPANIIKSSNHKLCAIDWEYASMGDPYFDMAVVVEAHGMDQTSIFQLLRDYHGLVPDRAKLRRLYHNRIVYGYLSVLWYGVQCVSGSNAIGSSVFDEKLSELKTLLANNY